MQRKDRSFAECVRRITELSHYAETDMDLLVERLGEEHLRKRLNAQLDLYESLRQQGGHGDLRWQHLVMRTLIRTGLTCTGLMKRAQRNARSPVVEQHTLALPGLPEEFEGVRILQLSDFHFEFIPDLPEVIRETLQPLETDYCVLTGDYRGETTGPYEESLEHLARCRDLLGEKVYAVLGNHDNVELFLGFPELGITPLMNETVWLERGQGRIRLCGVDDPQHYQTHDLSAVTDPDWDGVSILLSHTPEIYREAADAGFSAMWCGHTHGGQLCLPGGIPVIAHLGGSPRACAKGAWEHKGLQGYTSRGIGCSTLDVRLNCPPEITVHTLRKRDSE